MTKLPQKRCRLNLATFLQAGLVCFSQWLCKTATGQLLQPSSLEDCAKCCEESTVFYELGDDDQRATWIAACYDYGCLLENSYGFASTNGKGALICDYEWLLRHEYEYEIETPLPDGYNSSGFERSKIEMMQPQRAEDIIKAREGKTFREYTMEFDAKVRKSVSIYEDVATNGRGRKLQDTEFKGDACKFGRDFRLIGGNYRGNYEGYSCEPGQGGLAVKSWAEMQVNIPDEHTVGRITADDCFKCCDQFHERYDADQFLFVLAQRDYCYSGCYYREPCYWYWETYFTFACSMGTDFIFQEATTFGEIGMTCEKGGTLVEVAAQPPSNGDGTTTKIPTGSPITVSGPSSPSNPSEGAGGGKDSFLDNNLAFLIGAVALIIGILLGVAFTRLGTKLTKERDEKLKNPYQITDIVSFSDHEMSRKSSKRSGGLRDSRLGLDDNWSASGKHESQDTRAAKTVSLSPPPGLGARDTVNIRF